MTNQHPIVPPPELVQQWAYQRKYLSDQVVFSEIAQWGADQELEACCEWLEAYDYDEVGRQLAEVMHAARRPKPSSLKEQALEQLDGIAAVFRMSHGGNLVCDTIRRALEALPE